MFYAETMMKTEHTTLYLASTSPARMATLAAAGITPIAIAPEVDEDAAAEAEAERIGRALTTPEMVLLLARAKAEAICDNASTFDGIIFGGDSAFELDGKTYGKPHYPDVAKERILAQRGHTGVLYSGHWIIDMRKTSPSLGQAHGAVSSATVTMAADFSEQEIDDYIATGEPLKVAGSFTIDSLGSAFIEKIEGDPSTVVGLSVLTLRRLTNEFGIAWSSFWNSEKSE